MATLTEDKILEAADQLMEQGENPTMAKIREYLGNRGSFTTINQALKKWKAKQAIESQPIKVEAPEAITARLSDLGSEIWEIAQQLANQTLSSERQVLEQARIEMESSHSEAIALADQLNEELETEKAQNVQMVADIKGANELLEARKQTSLDLQKRFDALEIHGKQKDIRIQDLEKQLTHSQSESKSQRETHSAENRRLSEKLDAATQAASDHRSEAASLQGELRSLRTSTSQQLETAETQLAMAKTESTGRIQELTNQHDENMKRSDQLVKDAQTLASEQEKLAASLQGEIKGLVTQNEQLSKALATSKQAGKTASKKKS